MANTTRTWGTVGAWAADAEREDAEERENLAKNPHLAAAPGGESQSFPSLKESAAVKPKKKKGVSMSLSEFTSGTVVGPGAGARRDFSMETKRLTPDEMRFLPTGPRERSAEEMDSQGRLGGGFKNYGGRNSGPGGGGRMGRGDEGGDGAWGGGGGGGGGGGRRSYGEFDDERRSAPPPREDLPSRADEVDNWATTKRAPMESGRQDRYGSGDSGRQDRYSALGGGSRADEVDNWAVGKKPLPVRSTNSFGSGFRDPVGPEPDRWGRSGPPPPRDGDSDRWSRTGPPPPREGGDRERTRLVLDPPRGDVIVNDSGKTSRPSPFGAARPREEVLAEKGVDLKTSRPTSGHSSRPSSAHSNRSEGPASQVLEITKSKRKVNPFGDAKPREVLLQEQGKDWRKIDFELEHRSVDRPESMEEQMLKEEIEALKKEVEKVTGRNANGVNEETAGLQEMLLNKEKDLELLIRELDDKVRFGQKASSERPGSGSGRPSAMPERPPSQSGMPEDFRNAEYSDRPRSRGTGGDGWTRPVEDRRSFPGGGREGGYLRDERASRPRSRERW